MIQLQKSKALLSSNQNPSLDLNFLNGVLDSRITFARASSATYYNSAGVITTSATNAPRFDYNPSTLTMNGLLIEEARTNLAHPSTNWQSTAAATSSAVGYTQNAGVAPDGTTTALQTLSATGAINQQTYIAFSGAVSTVYTYSIYVKAAGYNYVYLNLTNTSFPTSQTAIFNLSAGTVLTQPANGSATIQSVGNGWYRCSVQNTSSATAGNYIMDILPSVTGADGGAFTGNGISGLLLWGQMVEAGAFTTSYIPTTSAAATRAAETASMPVSAGWYNQSAGSLAIAWMWEGTNSQFAAPCALLGANVNTDYIGVDFVTGIPSTLSADSISVAGTSQSATYSVLALPAGVVVKGAVSASVNTSILGVHNTTGTSGGLITAMPVITTLGIFPTVHFQNPMSGWMQRIRYYPRRLLTSQLMLATNAI